MPLENTMRLLKTIQTYEPQKLEMDVTPYAKAAIVMFFINIL